MAVLKGLSVLYHTADYMFISFEITEPMFVTLQIEYSLSLCCGGVVDWVGGV